MIKSKMISFYIAVMMIGTCTVKAQDDDKSLIHKIGFDVRPSYVAPTSKFLKDDGYGNGLTLRKAASFHLKYGFLQNPNAKEGQLYPHTYQGIGISYNTFGNRQEVGNPWAAYVFQSSRIAKISSRLSFDYEWNFGASFGWHPYDENNNYRNKIIGSKINAYINLGFFLNAKLSRYCNLLVGADLTHYSNGNTHLPNAGLNTIGGRIGLVYTLNPIEESHHEIGTPRSLPENQLYLSSFWQRVSYDVILYGATRAKGVMLGDEAHIFPGQFGILGFNLNPMYKFNRFLKAGISLDGQYDESANIYSDEIIKVGEEPRFYRPPLHEQIGIGLSARGEFTMPFFSINIGVGHNLFYNKGDLKGLYQILALKVSVTRNLFLHVGYQLHKFHNPNNLMLGVGYRFHN
ncbi:acyloxyacyl hydrolase [Parabacteroides sp.]